MKKEKTLTIREEKDYTEIIDDIDDLLIGYHLTFIEILGILEIYKNLLICKMDEAEEE